MKTTLNTPGRLYKSPRGKIVKLSPEEARQLNYAYALNGFPNLKYQPA